MPLSEKQIRQERNRWLIPLRRRYVRMVAPLAAIFDKYVKLAAADYAKNETPGGALDKLFLARELKDFFKARLKPVMKFSADTTSAQIQSEIKNDFDLTLYLAEWVETQQFINMMEIISTTFYQDLQEIIGQGISQEMTRRDIEKNILEIGMAGSKTRAKVIARNETHKASMYASERRAKEGARSSQRRLVVLTRARRGVKGSAARR